MLFDEPGGATEMNIFSPHNFERKVQGVKLSCTLCEQYHEDILNFIKLSETEVLSTAIKYIALKIFFFSPHAELNLVYREVNYLSHLMENQFLQSLNKSNWLTIVSHFCVFLYDFANDLSDFLADSE